MGASLPTFLGGDGRDDDAAKAALDRNTAQNTQAFDNWDSANKGNMAQNSFLGKQNYYGNAAQVYGQQQNAAGMLQQQANGTAPSAAQIQMGLGLSNANQQAQSAALSQQGGVLSGNTQRNMLNAQASNSQNILGQSAELRAKEQATAQQQYAQMLGGMQTQQQNQGLLRYNQGQNALNYNTTQNGQMFDNASHTANTLYANANQEVQQGAAAAQAGGTRLGGLVSSVGQGIATGGASSLLSGVGGGGGSSRTWGMDPNTGYMKGY